MGLDKYFNLTSLKELKDSKEDTKLEWVIEGLLLKGSTSILAAREKTGKSTLARQLALAVADSSQKAVLGRRTTTCDVLYLALDDRKKLFRRHIERLGGNWLDNFHVHFQQIKKANPVEAIEAYMMARPETGLIIIDTWQKFFTGVKSTNDYNEVIKAMRPMTDLAEQYNIHIMYLHHMNKGGDDVEDISKIMGSAAITSEPDSIITMFKKESSRGEGDYNNYISATVVGGSALHRRMLVWNKEKECYDLQRF